MYERKTMAFIRQNGVGEVRNAAIWLFLIGLFSQTQINIGGKLGISEALMVACAPFVFARNYLMLARDKVVYFFVLVLLWLAGAVFVDIYTHNYLPFMMRGIAVPITVFANCVCIYTLLRKDFDNLKWFLLGVAISGVVSIFIFQRGFAGDVAEEQGLAAGMEKVVGYKLFWVKQLTTWLTLPIVGWYKKVPKLYSLVALLFLAAFNLTTGGRSAFLVVAVSLLLVLFAGKTRRSLELFKKHVVVIVALLCLLGVLAKVIYEYAAVHGYMGEKEETKYEQSTDRGSGAIDLLMSGRGEFFIGMMAAMDKPILGHGSVAIDDHGYVLDFFSRRGDIETYERIVRVRQVFGARVIPAHSHVITFWLWHGIWGLVFWVCVIMLAVRTLLFRSHLYPPWFGYLAVTIPSFIWDVFFSPFSGRVQEAALFVVFLLIAKLQRNQKNGLEYA